MRLRFIAALIAFVLLATIPTTNSLAGDWPQILGPNRDGHAATDETLASSWPEGGPKIAWQRKVGDGFAGMVVSDGTAVLFHRVGARETVEAMNAKTGKVLWSKGYAVDFASGFSPDQGPRCTPVIHDGRVYTYGVQGRLDCFDLATGKEIWFRKTHAEFKAPEGYFGAGSSPIIEGDLILVNVGAGRAGAGVVAFDRKTGKTVWKALDEMASYSSPAAVTVNGTRHVVFITRMKTVSLDPKTGKVRFEFPFGKRGPTINGSTPVFVDGHVFLTAHYGVGAVFAKMDKTGAKEVWNSDALMSSQYMTSITHKDSLIGIHGQERVDTSVLRCFDPKTQKVRWSKSGFGYGTLIAADGKMLGLTTTGTLTLFEASEERYSELARADIFRSTTRAIPALSGGLLYVRDTGTLKCLDVGRE
jgi:outer membrane protein assembly factor BamB